MKLAVKISLIVATSLVMLGIVIFAVAMSLNGWDFKKLSNGGLESKTYEEIGDFNNISITALYEDVEFLPFDGDGCKIVCDERSKMSHSVVITDGALKIQTQDDRAWYEKLFNFGEEKMTVYLPNSEYGALNVVGRTGDILIPKDFTFESIDVQLSTGDVECFASAKGAVKITASTGDIDVEGITASVLELTVSTGDIDVKSVSLDGEVKIKVSTGETDLSDLTCNSLVSSGNTGDIGLKNVIVSGSVNIERSTGDVEFNRCDASEIVVKTDTGDVNGTLLSDKIFFVETDTGRVSVPKTTTGGKCTVTTSTGNIIFEIAI